MSDIEKVLREQIKELEKLIELKDKHITDMSVAKPIYVPYTQTFQNVPNTLCSHEFDYTLGPSNIASCKKCGHITNSISNTGFVTIDNTYSGSLTTVATTGETSKWMQELTPLFSQNIQKFSQQDIQQQGCNLQMIPESQRNQG